MSTQPSYLTSDHLGSPRINTDASGNVAARHDYMPFGEEIVGVGGRSGVQHYTAGDNVRQQFTGQQRDNEVNLDHFNARNYAFALGRFLSADNFGGKLSNPKTLNLYAYALNNPIKWVDPTGHFVSNPDGCKDKDGADKCTADKNNGNVAKKPDGSDYFLPDGPDMVVNVSGGESNTGPSDQSGRDAGPPDLPDSWIDLFPVFGSGRRMLYNMNCNNGGGCNVDRAVRDFAHTSIDAATLVEGLWKIGGKLFAEEVIEETTEVGTTTAIRGTEEEAATARFAAPESGPAIATSRTELVESLQNAGLPSQASQRTTENGLIFTDPQNGNLYRIMEGGTHHPPRLITSAPGGNPIAPWGGKIPSGILGRSGVRNLTHFPLRP